MFVTRPDIVGSWTLPQANKDLCMADGKERGANPDDSVYYGNFDPT